MIVKYLDNIKTHKKNQSIGFKIDSVGIFQYYIDQKDIDEFSKTLPDDDMGSIFSSGSYSILIEYFYDPFILNKLKIIKIEKKEKRFLIKKYFSIHKNKFGRRQLSDPK